MNATQSSPRPDGQLDAFLFATVGEEANGMALSVLSALSRLGIDPWADALRLSLLPKESAIVALGQSIARLPLGKWQPADTTAIATRLVALLPRPVSPPPPQPSVLAAAAAPKRSTTVVVALLVAGIGIYLLISGFMP